MNTLNSSGWAYDSTLTSLPQQHLCAEDRKRRQGDNMAPVLFLFLMTAFAQTLELEWKKIGIPILSVMTAGNEHLADGKICSHPPKMVKSKKLTTYEILQCLYVNDGRT